VIKAEFLLQSSVSHDPSEIILICYAALYTFLIINNIEIFLKVCVRLFYF